MDADIIRMARESGWSFMEAGMDAQRLARFAALVRAAEREACAQVCDNYDMSDDVSMCDTAEGIAAAIRARSKA